LNGAWRGTLMSAAAAHPRDRFIAKRRVLAVVMGVWEVVGRRRVCVWEGWSGGIDWERAASVYSDVRVIWWGDAWDGCGMVLGRGRVPSNVPICLVRFKS
jgi:hypothetical protein